MGYFTYTFFIKVQHSKIGTLYRANARNTANDLSINSMWVVRKIFEVYKCLDYKLLNYI